MTLIWHIVKKDLYRLRWILALWLIVIAAQMGATLIQAALDEFTFQPFYLEALLMGAGLLPLFTFGMVMGLVHDDPVADQDAFWITRPISSGQLLTAKSLGLVLLLFVPVLAALPWWIGHGYGAAQMGRATALTLECQLIISCLALPLAVLSVNGSRFVLNVILAAAGLLTLFLAYQLASPPARVASELLASRWVMVAAIWGAASMAIATLQFFGRRTRSSLVVAGVAAIGGFLAVRSWSWVFVPPKAAPMTISPAMTAPAFEPTKLAGGVTQFTARLDGAVRELKVVAEVPAVRDRISVREGYLVRVGEVFMNSLTGALEIPLGESTPYFSLGLDPRPANHLRTYYFLVHHGDGRSVAGKARPAGPMLDVSTLRYTHTVVSFSPSKEWRRSLDDDFATWGRGATLFKLVATASAVAAESSPTETKPSAEAETPAAKGVSL